MDDRPANSKTKGRGAFLKAMESFINKERSVIEDRHRQLVIRKTFAARTSTCSVEEEAMGLHSMSTEGRNEKLNLVGNCVRLLKTKDVDVHQYEVCIWPSVDFQPGRRQFIDLALKKIKFHKCYSLDRNKILVPEKLFEKDIYSVIVELPNSEGEVRVVIFNYMGLCLNSDLIEHYNTVLNSVLKKLGMHCFGRNYFSPKDINNVPQHRVEVWQGYDVGVQECESGFFLKIDIVSKVVHANSLLDELTNCYYDNRDTFKKKFETQVKGRCVLTKYNPLSYRVDSVTWEMNPLSTFVLVNEETTTFADYYKQRYDLEIKDKKQPLLIQRKPVTGSTSEPSSEIREIYLIPELCYLMGVTDQMRKNVQVIQNLNFLTRTSPNLHKTRSEGLVDLICSNEQSKAVLDNWGIDFDTTLARISGRLMTAEVLTIGGQRTFQVNNQGNWNTDIQDQEVLSSIPLKHWSVIFAESDGKIVRDFCDVLSDTFYNMAVEYKDVHPVEVPNYDLHGYMNAANKLVADTNVQLILFVVPANFDGGRILKTFCLETFVILFVVPLTKIGDSQRLRPFAREIAQRTVCALGGKLWSVHIPLNFLNTMVCAFEMHAKHHDSNLIGFVASRDHSFSRWHCSVAYRENDKECLDCLEENILEALNAYKRANRVLPDKIVIYRSGIPHSLMESVVDHEVKRLKEILSSLENDYSPELVVIIVEKTRTRLYLDTEILDKGVENPFPGTVIDHTVVSGMFHEFLLISQWVNQGTVVPSSNIVAYNDSQLDFLDLQTLTFKLCHLYFKCPFSVRYPAPIMYLRDIMQYYEDIPYYEGMPVYHDRLFFI